jgi:hypothetical protein
MIYELFKVLEVSGIKLSEGVTVSTLNFFCGDHSLTPNQKVAGGAGVWPRI